MSAWDITPARQLPTRKIDMSSFLHQRAFSCMFSFQWVMQRSYISSHVTGDTWGGCLSCSGSLGKLMAASRPRPGCLTLAGFQNHSHCPKSQRDPARTLQATGSHWALGEMRSLKGCWRKSYGKQYPKWLEEETKAERPAWRRHSDAGWGGKSLGLCFSTILHL